MLQIRHDTPDGALDTVVLAVAGEVDLSNTAELDTAIGTALITPEVRRVEIDLAETTFMDSAGLRVLVAGWQAASTRRIRFVARSPRPMLRRVFEITGIGRMLGVDADTDTDTAGVNTGTGTDADLDAGAAEPATEPATVASAGDGARGPDGDQSARGRG